MILSILKYFAKYPHKSGVLSMFANGASHTPYYDELMRYINDLPDALLPEIESFVFGQSYDTVKKRVDTITGLYLFVDFGEFSSRINGHNSIVDSQKIAITVATKMPDSADMVEEAITSNITLKVLSKLRHYLMSDAAFKSVPWMETLSPNHDIYPFVNAEFKSVGWTLILQISASDVFGLKPLFQSFSEQ